MTGKLCSSRNCPSASKFSGVSSKKRWRLSRRNNLTCIASSSCRSSNSVIAVIECSFGDGTLWRERRARNNDPFSCTTMGWRSAPRRWPAKFSQLPAHLISMARARHYNSVFNAAFPFAVLEAVLSPDDDPFLWRAALSTVTDDFLRRYNRGPKNKCWSMVVGACSHWLRPHQTRWTKAGGFAYPGGYRSFKPEFDWSVNLLLRDKRWVPVVRIPKRKPMFLRVVIPSRTARHKQAAIYTRWHPGDETILYGFRMLDGKWQCVAASDEVARERVSLPVPD